MMGERIIVLIDMDCFYCQVETKLNPSLVGKPLAVVQYNSWKGGGIIAVNYEARARGVNRYMRGDEAQKHCPDIELVRVATLRDKADLSKYRDASRDVFDVLCKYCDCVERASIDEAYLDVTSIIGSRDADSLESSQLSNTFIVGYTPNDTNDEDKRAEGTSSWVNDITESRNDADKNLALAGILVEEIRAKIFEITGFRCSAGIGHNKILAKLVCGLHKPNRQTILPHGSVPLLYSTLSVKKVRNLGGKFGDSVMSTLNCKTMGDLIKFTLPELQNAFDHKNGLWLYNIARGMDDEPVKPRLIAKSIGCCKRFPGKNCLSSEEKLKPWLLKLSDELNERINDDQSMNKRRATLMTVSATLGSNYQGTSKAVPFPPYSTQKIYEVALAVVKKLCTNQDKTWIPVYCLGISAGKFVNASTTGSLDGFLKSVYTCEYFNKAEKDTTETKANLKNDDEEGYFSKFLQKDETITQKANTENNSSNHRIAKSSKVSDSFNKLGMEKYFYAEESKLERSDEVLKPEIKKNDAPAENGINVDEKDLPNQEKSSLERTNSQEDMFGSENDNRGSSPPSIDHNIKVNSTEPSIVDQTFKGDEEKKKTSEDSMSMFLSGQCSTAVSIEEIFPDLEAIDDDLLQSLPFSLRKEILSRRRGSEKRMSTDVVVPKDSGRGKVSHKTTNRTMKSNTEKSNIKDMLIRSGKNSKPMPSTSASLRNFNIESTSSSLEISSTSTRLVEPVIYNEKVNPSWCEKCNKNISDNLSEHMDWHVAKELNAAWNKQVQTVHSSVSLNKNQQKRKKAKLDNKVKSIQSFFSSSYHF